VNGAPGLARLASLAILDVFLVDDDPTGVHLVYSHRAMIDARLATICRDTLSRVDVRAKRLALHGTRDLDRVVGTDLRAREATAASPVIHPALASLDLDGVMPASIIAPAAQVAQVWVDDLGEKALPWHGSWIHRQIKKGPVMPQSLVPRSFVSLGVSCRFFSSLL
jgi:hypothetical protein